MGIAQKLSKISFIQHNELVLQVESEQKYCDKKVKVFGGIPKTHRWYRLSRCVPKSSSVCNLVHTTHGTLYVSRHFCT